MTTLVEETAAPPAVSESEALEQHIRLTDAENECAHGHLPLDANPSCECWTLARTVGLLGQGPLTESEALDVMAGSELLPMNIDQEERMAQTPTEVLQEMYAYYEAGNSLAAVGEKYGMSGKTVGEKFRCFNMPVRPRGAQPGSMSHSTPVAPVEQAPAAVEVETAVPAYQATAEQLLDELAARIGELTAEAEHLTAVRENLMELVG